MEKQSRSGWDAWRRLCNWFEPDDNTRTVMWKSALLKVDLLEHGNDKWYDTYRAWRTNIEKYERQTGCVMPPNDMLGVVMLSRPSELALAMTLAPNTSKDFSLLEALIESHFKSVQSTAASFPGFIPMEVGALGKGTKSTGGAGAGKGGGGSSKDNEKKKKYKE